MDLIVNNSAATNDINRKSHRLLGRLLVDAKKLNEKDIQKILKRQAKDGSRFGDAAIALGKARRGDVMRALSMQFDYPLFEDGTNLDAKLVVARDPFGARAEAVRELRSQLQMRWFNAQRKILAVCSSRRTEGCSEVAANLALAFALMGKRTLLIDADLRQSGLSPLFKLPSGQGLSNMLAGRAALADCWQALADFEHLTLLPAGAPPPNPLELLNRPAFAELIKQGAEKYDIIILDTPPALASADAQLLASLAGGALLVTRRDVSRTEDLQRLKRLLQETGTTLVGATLLEK